VEPGSAYEYNDTRVNVLALAALQVWRQPLPEILRDKIMEPIGASNTWRWYGYDNSWIVLDGSASMDYPVGSGVSKWRMACAVAVGLAAVAHASGDPVGVLALHADGVLRMPPRTRRGTVREIARALDALRAGGTSALASALRQIPVTARCVLVTDCLGDCESTITNASVLAAGGAMLECVHVVAREELALPEGIFRAQDPEDATVSRVTSADIRSGYATRFDAFRAQVRDQWRALGAGYTEVTTDVAPARAVRAVVAGLAL
jgi:uncharacterized protein (DUF58 family)